ncbi:MAG TPA: DUF1902 domain-containing protein [Hyphomicrobiaceae bacterium]|nr:DUF1902 domain-containing protein [Hyphomicrobiaceae bacterium]
MMAISDDLPGLVVHARSDEELERKLAIVVRDLLEAEGFKVVSLTLRREEDIPLSDFGPPAFIAKASLTGADEKKSTGSELSASHLFLNRI